jgi:hypothetical protein
MSLCRSSPRTRSCPSSREEQQALVSSSNLYLFYRMRMRFADAPFTLFLRSFCTIFLDPMIFTWCSPNPSSMNCSITDRSQSSRETKDNPVRTGLATSSGTLLTYSFFLFPFLVVRLCPPRTPVGKFKGLAAARGSTMEYGAPWSACGRRKDSGDI